MNQSSKIISTLIFFFCLTPLMAAEIKTNKAALNNKLKSNFTSSVVLSCYAEPCSVQGDFDGDKKTDDAILIMDKATQKKGIAFILSNGKPVYVAAGKAIGNGNDNFDWMDAWHLYKKNNVERGTDEEISPVLKGDALLVEKSEAASALIYWDGKKFVWYQQGD